MNCPVCNVALTMTDRQGVEIDYCQKCRGVWLDRGELDKIIDRSSAGGVQPQQSQPQQQPQMPPPRSTSSGYQDRDRHYDREHEHSDHYKKKKKRESFLGELFDF